METNLRMKHACDRVFAFLLVLVAFPLIILIAASLLIESLLARQPIRIFVGERRRSAGRAFRLLKFRVFRIASLDDYRARHPGQSVKDLEGRPEHLSPVGRLLKRGYLDELPQLLNILRGEMSLVGPRPYFEGDWARQTRLDIPARRLLRAGLVGPYGSLKGRVSGAETENRLDAAYLEKISSAPGFGVFLADLRIILQSLGTVLRAKGL